MSWWLLLWGCPKEVTPVAPVDPPCSDTQSCWVGCGEGRDGDCHLLAGLVDTQARVERDTSRAVAEAGCAAGAATGCALAGELWLRGEDAVAVKNAAALLDRGCVRLSPRACALLGALLVEGQGIAADPHRAEELWKWSCDKGEPQGCRQAGVRAEQGPDVSLAAPFYQRGCDGGDAPSCRLLATLLDEGRGVPMDEAKARVLFDQACQADDTLGCAGRDRIDERVHPIERVTVWVFEVGYSGPPLARAARTREEALARAQAAVEALGKGAPLTEVVAAQGDGESREQNLIRMKKTNPLQDAAFALQPGQAVHVEDTSLGFLVIYRPA
jgi:hypothetical protein